MLLGGSRVCELGAQPLPCQTRCLLSPTIRQRFTPTFHHLGTSRARWRRADRQCPLLLSVPCNHLGTMVGSPPSQGRSLSGSTTCTGPVRVVSPWCSRRWATGISPGTTGSARAPSHSIPITERTPWGVGVHHREGNLLWRLGGPVGVRRRGEDGEGFLFKS